MSTFSETFLSKLAPWQRAMLERLLKLRAEGKSLDIPLRRPLPWGYVMGWDMGVSGGDFSVSSLMRRDADGTIHLVASERTKREPKAEHAGKPGMIVFDEVGYWPTEPDRKESMIKEMMEHIKEGRVKIP